MNRFVRVMNARRVPLLPESFEYNGRFGRIGRWLFGKLSKSAYRYLEATEVKTVDVERVVEAIMKQARSIDLIFNKELDYVLVGPDEFYGLADSMPPISFDANIRIHEFRELKVFGIRVRFVPWATGITCVPKES